MQSMVIHKRRKARVGIDGESDEAKDARRFSPQPYKQPDSPSGKCRVGRRWTLTGDKHLTVERSVITTPGLWQHFISKGYLHRLLKRLGILGIIYELHFSAASYAQ
ncbi:unnamed protein product [Gongylonema pulchrum]|uniref:Uncharacterized protein n=1 Tax=Gongylonema pulchrum TaxID=637853 RepID=A0A183D4F7_9BILA|nr:unnamed protein product [Gongylonema pulchrum]